MPDDVTQGPTTDTPATTQAEPTAATDRGAEGAPEERFFTQADLDRERTRAAETARRKAREEYERKQAEATNDWKAQAEAERQRREALEISIQTRDELTKLGVPELAGLFDGDVSTVEARVALGKSYKAAIEAAVQKRLDGMLRDREPERAGGPPAAPKRPDEMTSEEYVAWKATQGIH